MTTEQKAAPALTIKKVTDNIEVINLKGIEYLNHETPKSHKRDLKINIGCY